MTLDEYQRAAMRTWNEQRSLNEQELNAALGIAGEAGEVADLLKKYHFHGHDLDEQRVVKELGDVLYYVAALAFTLGYDLSEIAQVNITKLKIRYPEGFSAAASINRTE